MRTGSSDLLSRGHRNRIRQDARLKKARKSRNYWIDLEGLEARTLLATIPAATYATADGSPVSPINLTSYAVANATAGGNTNSPTVALNPYDSQQEVAIWGVDISNLSPTPLTTAVVLGAYSINGGQTWTALPGESNSLGGVLDDPEFYPVAIPYLQVTNPSLGFDSQGNFYVLMSEHNGVAPAPTSGSLVLDKFTFSGPSNSATVTPDFFNHVLYQWLPPGGDAALNPVVAVDAGTYPNSNPPFTTPPAGVPNDLNANKVYVAWASNNTAPANPFLYVPFNPNRAELISSSNGGASFTGLLTANLNGNVGPANDTHPQLVIDSGDNGLITVGWDDIGSGAGATPKLDFLTSNTVQPGTVYGPFASNPGTIFPPNTSSTPPEGDWAPATIYDAGPIASVPEDPTSVAVGDVSGDGKADIVVSDNNSQSGGLGVLINTGVAGPGLFPAAATVYPANNSPNGVVLANFTNHATATILDAALSNNTSPGAVSLLANSGVGVFGAPTQSTAGNGTDAVAQGNFDGSGASIVAVNKLSNTITIIPNPRSGAGTVTLSSPDLDAPTAVVVGDFNGDGKPDIAVLNSGNSTIKVFLDESTGVGSFIFDATTPAISVPGGNAVAMTGGFVTGSALLPDLVVVTNNPGSNDMVVLHNISAPGGATVSFNPQIILGTSFAGTPVGVATGILSNAGAYTMYQDIAVVYQRASDSESMVAAFRNLDNPISVSLERLSPAGGAGDYDALQTNPTAIALGNLGGNWDDIIVTNNAGRGTISVLQPQARPSPPIAPVATDFNVTVNVPDPAEITDLITTVALTYTNLAELSLVLKAPDGDSITLFTNQNNSAGQVISPAIGVTGDALGVFDYAPPTTPGLTIGTIFDDNATRDIVDINPLTGARGAAAPFIGNFRPESDFINGDTLDAFAQRVAAADPAAFNNGTWTLVVTAVRPESTAGFLREFNLDFATGQTRGSVQGSIASEFEYLYGSNLVPFDTIVVHGALGVVQPITVPSSPVGVGPGLVMAEDNTLGPDSPYQGRIYASFVGYFNVINPRGTTNPTTNTDIFLVYSDNHGETWSSPELVNDDQSSTDGFSASNDTLAPSSQITGRTQFMPEIAVDQATGTVVLSWRDARDDGANARVATYITASIDGGQTFNAQTYANPQKTAVDAITGQTDVLGPQSDNESGGNPQTDLGFGYGNQMGLAVFDGQIYPVWAGNFYGPDPAAEGFVDSFLNNGVVTGFPLNIWYQPMVIAAGPRIISSTMGPVIDNTLTGSASADVPAFIPPPFSSGATTSTIAMTGDPSLDVSSLEVTLSLIYPTDGNLTIKLVAPGGQFAILYEKAGDTGQNFVNTTFSDTAAQLITAGTAPYTGTFRPVQSLSSVFKNLQAVGNWTLEIDGGIGPHGGILQSWSLSINGVASEPTSFDVTFDRPVDPKGLPATFTAGDVEVFYHDTNSADSSIPLEVLGVAPIQPPDYVTDPTQNGTDGYTNFMVTFNPNFKPNGSPTGITDFTGTYSYVVAPDNGQVAGIPTAISSPIWSWINVQQAQPVITPVSISPTPPTGQVVDPNAKASPNLSIPTWGPGGSGTQFDVTQSTINLSGYNINQLISGLTVNVNIIDPLSSPGLGNDGDLFIELTAPNGSTSILYFKPGDTSQNFTNVTFSDHAPQSILLANGPYTNGTYQPFNPLTALNGSLVNGPYTLTIDNYQPTNSGTLVSWSITVDSTVLQIPQYETNPQPQTGVAMDQNADGTSDQNPLTTPFTGLVPGDAYVAPMPQPTTPFTFNAANILSPPFDQNTLPLILPGPYVMGTSVPSGTGTDNLVVDGTSSTFNVTFDRLMQASTFTPDQVLQIVGPLGSVTGPQNYPSNSIETIPAATLSGPSVLNSTVTVPSFNGTFKVAKITVELNAAFSEDAGLSAVLIAPNGTQVSLFSGVGGSGSNFINTVFDDSAENSITTGTAPFSGTYQPTGQLSTLDGDTVDIQNSVGQWVPGNWTLQITNSLRGVSGMLANWSLNITPVITVTPVAPQPMTVNGKTVQVATTFTIGFPQQQLSGTYSFQIGTNILDTNVTAQSPNGQPLDSNYNAGLDVLRGQSQNGPTTPVHYAAADVPKVIPAPAGSPSSQITSTIIVPNNFVIQGDTTSSGISGLRVQINLTYPNDPDLTITLQHYDLNGNLLGSVPLATGVGSGTNTANFSNTVFDDNATTPIQNGSAPFFATFNPQMSLMQAFAGMNAQGTWVLVVQSNSTIGGTGTINSWSLSFQKPVPTSGLGELGSDNASASFRIFTLGQADALSAESWVPVGPAAIGSGASTGTGEVSGAGGAGRIGGLAIDPSDPSGNTVYVAGASGGVWKTTDFLTTSPDGPTYTPLTDFAPTDGVNIGSIAVFPRNHDPNQSFIIAATGEGDTGTPGVGFLISQDGGATWNLYDSSVNVDSNGNLLPIESSNAALQRNREFVGATAYQVVVDPKLSPTGQIIIYAALSGPNGKGGIWRSEDSGNHWVNMLPGQATDVVLDPNSGTVLNPDTATAVQGNLQVVYAGIQGVGVEMSTNQGQLWNVMTGGVGNPLIQNIYNAPATNVNPGASLTPNGAEGRVVLAVPNPTGNAAEDPIYEGWLYAAVATPAGGFFGLFVTKDFGENWTDVRIPTLPPLGSPNQAIPTNDVTQPNYTITGGGLFGGGQGNYDLTLAVDPTDPNITYVGGSLDGAQTGLIRVDATNLWDAHSLVPYSNFSADTGLLNLSSTGAATVTDLKARPPLVVTPFGGEDTTWYLNFIRSPYQPFQGNDSTLQVFDYSAFTNNGAGVEWIPFDMGGTDYHRVVTTVDPTTGLPRLIFGDDQGVWSVLDNNGTFETQVGASATQLGSPTAQLPGINRNGNLQITQFYYGAAQPSTAAAELAGALFYGGAQDNGGPVSNPGVVSNGDITWSGPGGDSTGVGTDQQGSGSAYQYFWPCCNGGSVGGNYTDFFQYIAPGTSGNPFSYTGRTFGLLQTSNGLPTPDSQWPFTGGANFAVNPVNSADVVITSSVGRIFATDNQGVTWFDIGDPAEFGSPGSFSDALAYGAPDPNAPEGIGNLGNFIYVGTQGPPGTQAGRIYVTQDGGGSAVGNSWINISLGLDGSAVKSIITDPARGSHDAYAVTTTGVFYIKDSILLADNPTSVSDEWVNLTGNIHNLPYTIFGQNYDPTTDPNATKLNQGVTLSAIMADWRYAIPNAANDPAGPGFHPVLYVGSNSGVYQSTDNGLTWALFPDVTYGAVAAGGNLPHVPVTSFSLSLGNIDPNTGLPDQAGPDNPNPADQTAPDPDVLMASTYGQGEFAINLPPLILDNAVTVTPTVPGIGTNPPTVIGPITISGLSEITTFGTFNGVTTGNATWITIEDITDPADPKIIGGFNPANGIPTTPVSTGAGADATNTLGQFALPFDPATVYDTNGLKTIEVFATDNAGSVGNKVTYTFNLQDTNLPQPPPTSPPTFTSNLEISPADVRGTINNIPVTNLLEPTFLGATNTGVTLTVFEFEQVNGNFVPYGSTFTTTSDPSTGAFTFPFSNSADLSTGTFQVYVKAAYTNFPGVGSTQSNTVTFQINNETPLPVNDFRLNPADDTGIAGDNITTDRTPQFIGTAPANDTIELYQIVVFNGTLTIGSATVTGITSTVGLAAGQVVTGTGVPGGTTIQSVNSLTGTVTLSATATASGSQSLTSTIPILQNTAIASATTSTDSNGKPYDFSIQLPFVLNNGTISLEVIVIDAFSGNASAVSNPVTATIASVASDYNGDGQADPALFSRNATSNQLQWLVQTAAGTPPPWFSLSGILPFTFTGTLTSGSASITGVSNTVGLAAGLVVTGTGIPSGTTIQTVNPSAGTITLSAKATVSASQSLTAAFGTANVIPFQGDFDSDGKADLAYYDPTNATWYMDDSKQGVMSFKLGTPNSVVYQPGVNVSVPAVGVFDPNGPTEAAYFNNGVWSIISAFSGNITKTFGQAGDIPEPGNYDGLGYDELGVYRPSTGLFLVLNPVTGLTETFNLGVGSSPDLSSLVPVPGGYDNLAYYTAGKAERTEAAVYDPKTGAYTILGPNGAYSVYGFQSGEIPAPADYSGSGSTQPVVYQASTGRFLLGTTTVGGAATVIATFGSSGDIPLAAPLSYRLPSDPPADPPSTGTGTTGTGTTGSGTGTTGSGTGTTGSGTGTTGTGTGTTGKTGSSSSGQSSSSGSSTTTPPPAQSPGSGTSHPGSSSHKKKLTKPPVHHKKPVVHVKHKAVQHHAAKKPKVKVHIVRHSAAKVVTASASSSALAKPPAHVVDLALEGIHANLRRSSSGKGHQG